MTTAGPVLAVDQGTSGTKALVVCPERGVLAEASVEVRPRYGDDGSVETDPAELLESVLTAGRRAVGLAGEPVRAVGLANQGETVLAWDPVSGTPLTTAIGWQDHRCAVVCDELAARDGQADSLLRLTGLPLDPYFAAPKLTWLRRTLTRDGVVTTTDAWLLHALTGAFVTDVTTASRTMLLDLDARAWAPDAVAAFGLDREALPRIMPCAGEIGPTDAFTPGTPVPVTGLAVDQQAALVAQGCLDAGTAKCTYGTGAFLLANVGDAPVLRSAHGLATSVAFEVPSATATSASAPAAAGSRAAYCVDGQVYTVASAVRWLTDLGVLRGAEELDAVGGSVPDAGGVVFVPAFAGLAAPTWRSQARAGLSGLGLGTSRGHVVRALVEGIAAQVADLTDCVARDLGAPLRSLRVDGGLTRSRLLLQTQADLLQVPVEVYPSADATALGVAVLALLGLDPGGWPDGLGAVVRQVSSAVAGGAVPVVHEPSMPADRAAEILARHRAAAAAG